MSGPIDQPHEQQSPVLRRDSLKPEQASSKRIESLEQKIKSLKRQQKESEVASFPRPKNPYKVIAALNDRMEKKGSTSCYDYSSRGIHVTFSPENKEALLSSLRATGVTNIGSQGPNHLVFHPTKEWWGKTVEHNHIGENPQPTEIDGTTLYPVHPDEIAEDVPNLSPPDSSNDNGIFGPDVRMKRPQNTLQPDIDIGEIGGAYVPEKDTSRIIMGPNSKFEKRNGKIVPQKQAKIHLL